MDQQKNSNLPSLTPLDVNYTDITALNKKDTE